MSVRRLPLPGCMCWEGKTDVVETVCIRGLGRKGYDGVPENLESALTYESTPRKPPAKF